MGVGVTKITHQAVMVALSTLIEVLAIANRVTHLEKEVLVAGATMPTLGERVTTGMKKSRMSITRA